MAEEVVVSVASILMEPMLKRMTRPVRYVFNFNKTAEELKKKTKDLKSRQDYVQDQVEQANRNAEDIKEDVKEWQGDVEKMIMEVQRLEEEKDEKKSSVPNVTWRYHFVKQATRHIAAMTRLYENGNFIRVSDRVRCDLPGIQCYETKDFSLYRSASFAFQEILKELRDGKKKMIALHGMGGVGKTTLAVEVGKKAKELKLVDEVVMATATQNPNIETIQDHIAAMLGLKFEEKTSIEKAMKLSLRLGKKDKNTLIILDDVWKKLDLATVGIPSGCTILLTTREQEVCNAMSSEHNIALGVLTDDEAWDLFKRNGNVSDDPSFLIVAKSIAKECKGLPLAIAVVASTLKDKPIEDWEVTLQQLRGSRYANISKVDKDVYTCLRLSYDYLPNADYKLCFLICSLFPEDYLIKVEVLVRLLSGLGLCEDVAEPIDGVRKQVHAMIRRLQASHLLLSRSETYSEEKDLCVRMHDVVRDVALWISSVGESNHVFMGKSGMGLKEWQVLKRISYNDLTAVSLMKNEIAQHCNGLVYSRLKLLLLDENGCYTFPDKFFNGMKSLQVFSLCLYPPQSPLSFSLPQSMKKLQSLHTLRLEGLLLNDISVVGKLKRLDILSLRGSIIEELPNTIGELNGLKMLDLSDCKRLEKIPANSLSKLAKLEELYMGGGTFSTHWKEERNDDSAGSCNASLSELMSLSKLSILCMDIDKVKQLPDNFCFSQCLERYDSRIGGSLTRSSYPISKSLRFKKLQEPKLVHVYRELMCKVNSIVCSELQDIHNVIPTMDDRTGLNELTNLDLDSCSNIECLLDATQPWTAASAFSKLGCLRLKNMTSCAEMISGSPPNGFLAELHTLQVEQCHELPHIFPPALVTRLQNLSKVTILQCTKVNEIFQLEKSQRSSTGEEENYVLCSLTELMLWELPSLTRIWKGPTEVVSLVKLRKLEVFSCPKLTSLLSVSIARSMVQLETLMIRECKELKQIIFADGEELKLQSIDIEANGVCFPELSKLELEDLPHLINFSQGNYISLSSCPALDELCIAGCPNIGTHFIADLEARMQDHAQKLQVVVNVKGIKCKGLQEKLLTPSLSKVVEEMVVLPSSKKVEPLQVEGVGKLSNAGWKRLILDNLPHLQSIWRGSSQIAIFHNLLRLCITHCDGLKKHLLTISIARSLLQLSDLYVEECRELEQIFAVDDHDEDDKRIVVLPKLRLLQLQKLKNLIGFCPTTFHFMFPCKSFKVIVCECPKNTTGFSVQRLDENTKTVVHAKGKALCTVDNKGKCDDIEGIDDLPLEVVEEIDDEEIAEVDIS